MGIRTELSAGSRSAAVGFSWKVDEEACNGKIPGWGRKEKKGRRCHQRKQNTNRASTLCRKVVESLFHRRDKYFFIKNMQICTNSKKNYWKLLKNPNKLWEFDHHLSMLLDFNCIVCVLCLLPFLLPPFLFRAELTVAMQEVSFFHFFELSCETGVTWDDRRGDKMGIIPHFSRGFGVRKDAKEVRTKCKFSAWARFPTSGMEREKKGSRYYCLSFSFFAWVFSHACICAFYFSLGPFFLPLFFFPFPAKPPA